MTFLALASQKSLLSLQKSFLQFQLLRIQNDMSYYAAEMGAIKKSYQELGNSDKSFEDDADYIYYEQLDEQLGAEKDSVESQMQVIENEISGLKTLVQNGIKSSCTLNMASGG